MKRKHYRKKSSHIEVLLIICVILIISLSIIIAWVTLGKVEKDAPDENRPWDYDSSSDQILSSDTIIGTAATSEKETQSAVKLNVRAICQYPELPTGCEATAAVMALNYLGASVYLEPFANLLPQQPLTNSENRSQGPDPNVSFVGDPHKETGRCPKCKVNDFYMRIKKWQKRGNKWIFFIQVAAKDGWTNHKCECDPDESWVYDEEEYHEHNDFYQDPNKCFLKTGGSTEQQWNEEHKPWGCPKCKFTTNTFRDFIPDEKDIK